LIPLIFLKDEIGFRLCFEKEEKSEDVIRKQCMMKLNSQTEPETTTAHRRY
jgi:hypothetical protein